MKCMCAQTRPQFILSSEGVLGGMEFEPMITPREKSPLPENVPRGSITIICDVLKEVSFCFIICLLVKRDIEE